jgi:hypothetical protein
MPEEKEDEDQLNAPNWFNKLAAIAATVAFGAIFALKELDKDNISITYPVFYQKLKLALILIRSFAILFGARLLIVILGMAKNILSKK